MSKTVRVIVAGGVVQHVEVPEGVTVIEASGKLIDAMTDHAETEDEVEANRRLLDSEV